MFSDPTRVSKGARTTRHSSWDRSGANHDFLDLQPGETVTLLDTEGPGKVTHFYWTTINASRNDSTSIVRRVASASVVLSASSASCSVGKSRMVKRMSCPISNKG